MSYSPSPVILYDFKRDLIDSKDPKILSMISRGWNTLLEEQLSTDIIHKMLEIQLNSEKPVRWLIAGSAMTSYDASRLMLIRLIQEVSRVHFKIKPALGVRELILAVDEADIFAPKSGSSGDTEITKQCKNEMTRLFSKMRSLGVRGWALSQRISMLHNDVIMCCTDSIQFYMSKRDLNAVEPYFEGVKKLEFNFRDDPHRFYINHRSFWTSALHITL